MKSVGMNPSEQELLDMINEVTGFPLTCHFEYWTCCLKFLLRWRRKEWYISKTSANWSWGSSGRTMRQNLSRWCLRWAELGGTFYYKRFFRSKSEIFLLVDQNSSLSSQYPNKFPIIAAVRKQISPLSNILISFFSVFMWDNISLSTDFYSLNAYCITI